MANECICGIRHIEPATTRFIITQFIYLEWDKECPNLCGDTEIIQYITPTMVVWTGTLNELWVHLGGDPDTCGLITDGSV